MEDMSSPLHETLRTMLEKQARDALVVIACVEYLRMRGGEMPTSTPYDRPDTEHVRRLADERMGSFIRDFIDHPVMTEMDQEKSAPRPN